MRMDVHGHAEMKVKHYILHRQAVIEPSKSLKCFIHTLIPKPVPFSWTTMHPSMSQHVDVSIYVPTHMPKYMHMRILVRMPGIVDNHDYNQGLYIGMAIR